MCVAEWLSGQPGLAFQSFGGVIIHEREDIKIISHLLTVGSTDCFNYSTEKGPAVPHQEEGEFDLILQDETEVTDFSPKNLKPISVKRGERF